MRIISWNVNGLRSNIVSTSKKSIYNLIDNDSNLGKLILSDNPDILCFQETRCDEKASALFKCSEYPHKYWKFSEGKDARSGSRYSGVAIWSKIEAKKVEQYPVGFEEEKEGRILVAYFEDFILINTYCPNSGTNFEKKVSFWQPAILNLLKELNNTGLLVIWTGDFNVAAYYKDISITQSMYNSNTIAGCLTEEIDFIRNLLETEQPVLYDTFRRLHPDSEEYTWFDMRSKAKLRNKGWRIDYFMVNNMRDIKESKIIDSEGSDHIPIFLSF